MLSTRDQKWAVWCGPTYAVMFFVGLILLKFLPPPPGTLTGEQFFDLVTYNINLARLGVIIGLLGAILSIPWKAKFVLYTCVASPARWTYYYQ